PELVPMGDSNGCLRCLPSRWKSCPTRVLVSRALFEAVPGGQEEPMTINFLDISIIARFVTVIGFGFFSGVTRVTSAIFAMYLASIISAAFYRPLTDSVREYVPSMGLKTGRLFFFTVLFFISL